MFGRIICLFFFPKIGLMWAGYVFVKDFCHLSALFTLALFVNKIRSVVKLKVRKTPKIRKRYNQVSHLTQETTWESNKNSINIINKSQEVSPFPAGDHKAAMNRRESMRNTNDPQRKYRLERSVKIFYLRA